MAGLDPAIHVCRGTKEDVDGRVKPGHDDQKVAESSDMIDSMLTISRLIE